LPSLRGFRFTLKIVPGAKLLTVMPSFATAAAPDISIPQEMDLRVVRLGDEPGDHAGECHDFRLIVHGERVVGHGGIRQKAQRQDRSESGDRDLPRQSLHIIALFAAQ
jgi:hypothetical protein